MAAKNGENFNFSTLHSTLLYYPAGQKFAQNWSISYHFEDIFNVLFCNKIQDGRQSGENWNYSPFHRTLLYYPVGQKFAQNCSISYGFWDIHTFSFSAKIQDGCQKWQKFKFYPFCIGHSYTTVWVKISLKITLCLTVFEIFTLFHFPLKSKMAAKSGENWNFTILHKTLVLYCGTKISSTSFYLLRFSRYSHFFIFR